MACICGSLLLFSQGRRSTQSPAHLLWGLPEQRSFKRVWGHLTLGFHVGPRGAGNVHSNKPPG